MITTRLRSPLVLLLAGLAVLQSGCFTGYMWEQCRDASVALVASSVWIASDGSDSLTVKVEYTDGTLRVANWSPSTGQAEWTCVCDDEAGSVATVFHDPAEFDGASWAGDRVLWHSGRARLIVGGRRDTESVRTRVLRRVPFVLLTPFTLVLDLVTSPVQLVGLLIVMAGDFRPN